MKPLLARFRLYDWWHWQGHQKRRRAARLPRPTGPFLAWAEYWPSLMEGRAELEERPLGPDGDPLPLTPEQAEKLSVTGPSRWVWVVGGDGDRRCIVTDCGSQERRVIKWGYLHPHPGSAETRQEYFYPRWGVAF